MGGSTTKRASNRRWRTRNIAALAHAAANPTPVGSTFERRSRTATRVTMADTSAQPERKNRPASKLPVVSLSQPTAMGPITPPRLPIELIPAAAVALRNEEGSG